MTGVDRVREYFHSLAGVLVWPVMLGLLALSAAMRW